jgi:C-terminal processing protease CtpA/Prc
LHVRRKFTPPPDRRPWLGPLGGGVAASVPLELSTRDGKTVPAAGAPPASEPRLLVPSDRATRLASVIIAWNIFEHFYPYFDVRGTDWKPELPLRLREAALDDGVAAFHKTLHRLTHDLYDGHGFVFNTSEDRSRVVPWLWEWVEGKLAITQIAEPCACDLKPGDVVTAIDGVPTERAAVTAGELIPSATEQYRAYQALGLLAAGPEGSRRAVTIERNGAVHDVDVPLIERSLLPAEKRPANGDEVAPGIRYIKIDDVTAEQWTKMLPEVAAGRGLIVDARGYPGPGVMVPLLEHFTKKPMNSAHWNVPTPARPDREGMTFVESHWTVPPREPHVGHLVFLTDGRAASAAETFMGIVEHYKLGDIVGSATAGTNGNVNPFTVPGGYVVRWTGLQTLKQDGSRHHGVGILPTVPAARTLAGVAAQRDEVLEKGIEVALRNARQGRQRK